MRISSWSSAKKIGPFPRTPSPIQSRATWGRNSPLMIERCMAITVGFAVVNRVPRQEAYAGLDACTYYGDAVRSYSSMSRVGGRNR